MKEEELQIWGTLLRLFVHAPEVGFIRRGLASPTRSYQSSIVSFFYAPAYQGLNVMSVRPVVSIRPASASADPQRIIVDYRASDKHLSADAHIPRLITPEEEE